MFISQKSASFAFALATTVLANIPASAYALSTAMKVRSDEDDPNEPNKSGESGKFGEGEDEDKGNDGLGVFLQSWGWASFGVCIVAEIFAISLFFISIQSLARYHRYKHIRPEPAVTDSQNTGAAFCCYCMLGSFFLVAYFPLLLLQNVLPDVFDTQRVSPSHKFQLVWWLCPLTLRILPSHVHFLS